MGHAFHNHILGDQRILNRDYTMPVAETASTFNECVVMNAAIAAATDKEEKLALIESQLSDATQIICDIYSRYRFESAVFANRENDFLPADRLCEMMLEAQKQSYGDGLMRMCSIPTCGSARAIIMAESASTTSPTPSAACLPGPVCPV